MRTLTTKQAFKAEIDKFGWYSRKEVSFTNNCYFKIKKTLKHRNPVKDYRDKPFIVYGYVLNKSREVDVTYRIQPVDIESFLNGKRVETRQRILSITPFLGSLNTTLATFEYTIFDNKEEFDRSLFLEDM